MQCERATELISRAIDDELDTPEKERLSAHLAQCPSCVAVARDFRRLGEGIASLGHMEVPPGLKKRVLQGLAHAEHLESDGPPSVWARVGASQLMRMAAAVVISALVASGATVWALRQGDAGEQLRRDIVSAHVRSLLQDSPIQVASSDTHTVKPWFAGRVEISPVVRDLAADGFTLVGGRLDYVDGRRVGVLVYRQRQHLINVFALPGKIGIAAAPEASLRNGYNVLTWVADGITYSAISDINLAELQRLRGLL